MTRPLPIAEAELHAYVDDELDEERCLAVKEWLAAHPDDAARVGQYRALGRQWRETYASVLHEPVPAELLTALEVPRRSRWRRLGWRTAAAWSAAAAFMLALMAVAAWTIIEPHRFPGSLAAEMVERAAIAHAVYAGEAQHPVEGGERTNGELLAWLSQRLHMAVKAPDLEPVGLALLGGRLLPGETAPAAMLMYEGTNGERVTLYWGPEFRREPETGLRFAHTGRRERVYYWLDDECGYAVTSSDLGQRQLLRVALLAYAQLEH